MKKTKLSAIVFVIIFVFISLFGCSSVATPNGTSGTKSVGTNSASTTTGSKYGTGDPKSYSGKITMWSHTADQPKFMIEHYRELYPNVQIELTIIPSAEHQQKVQNAVSAGNAPDIFTTKTDFIKYIVSSSSFYDDLLSAPYQATHLSSNIYKEIVQLGSDSKGALRGLSWQVPAGAIWYRRALAKTYFGTDDPAEVSKLFANMDTILASAKKLNTGSNGKVKLIGDYKELTVLYKSMRKDPYVVDGNIKIDPALTSLFSMAKTFYDDGLTAKVKQFDSNWSALMENGGLFCYILPTWGLTNNISLVFPKSKGDWGIADSPVGWTLGGTWMGIYAKSANKEIAYTFLNFVFSNEDFVYDYAMNFGDYVSNVKVQQKIGALPSTETAKYDIFNFINNQNFYAYFNKELAGGIRLDLTTKYDATINTILASALDLYVSGQKSSDDAWKQYVKDVQDTFPELKYQK